MEISIFFGELLIILGLVLINAIFAMSEMAVVSARRVRLQRDAHDGSRSAKAALTLIESPQSFLSTVQVGITLIGILAGVYGGATVAGTLETFLSRFSWLAPYSGILSYVVVIAIITYFSLILGELLPKRLALSAPEKIAKVVARPMRGLSIAFYPLVLFLDRSTEFLFRLFPITTGKDAQVTEEEIELVLTQGKAAGIIEHEEREILQKVLRLDDKPARAIMTPRTELGWIDITKPPSEILELVAEHPYSVFPVGEGSLDNTLGIVTVQDILSQRIRQPESSLRELIKVPIKIPESLSGLQVLELMKNEKVEIVLVVDEYGSVRGILTLHDLMEALVGAIPSASDEEPDFTVRADGSILVDASMDVTELFHQLKLSTESIEDSRYHSVGGFVMEQLGHVPRTGETFDHGRYTFEVIDMDRQRIDKVLVSLRVGASNQCLNS